MKTDRVANLLNDWLSSNRYQQTALARKSGLTQLSFLRNGLRGMTTDALDRLLPALREEDRPVLLKQWVQDSSIVNKSTKASFFPECLIHHLPST